MHATSSRSFSAVAPGPGFSRQSSPKTDIQARRPSSPVRNIASSIFPSATVSTSGLKRIFLLTQFNSSSLHRHIQQSYRFDDFSSGFVEIMAAQQTPSSESWYQGTADAVRQNLQPLCQFADRTNTSSSSPAINSIA